MAARFGKPSVLEQAGQRRPDSPEEPCVRYATEAGCLRWQRTTNDWIHTMSNTTVNTGAAVRRVSWGSIFVGTVVAMALMVLFATLGLAIGAAAVDPVGEGSPLSGLGVGSGIYLVLTQLISLAIGGYAAARLAGVPRTISSLLHGASVWALATLLLTWAASCRFSSVIAAIRLPSAPWCATASSTGAIPAAFKPASWACVEDIAEPGLRIDVVELGRHDQGVRRSVGHRRAPKSQLFLPSATRHLGAVVGRANPSVLEEQSEGRPTALLEHVVDGLGDIGVPRHLAALDLQPVAQALDQRA